MSATEADQPRSRASAEPPFGFWRRSYAMLVKEFIQLRRDRVSFAMIVMIPVMQLLLFGYRHQHHAAPSADGGADPGGQRSGALGAEGAGEYQLLPLHPRSAQRRRIRRSPAVRQGAVRGRDPARFRARGAARRQAGAAGRRRRDRSGRGRLCARLARHGGADRARARPPHRRSGLDCRSRSGRMPATTRPRNRGSTSCRAWSAPS